MTSNLPAVILIASLVSCHPAPAIAAGMSAFVNIQTLTPAAAILTFTNIRATERERLLLKHGEEVKP